MKKMFLMVAVLFVVCLSALPLMAQVPGITLDQATVDLIMAGVGGVTVIGLTELIKLWTKGRISGYVISATVSLVATAVYLIRAATFAWPIFIGYSVLVFAVANGFYKATKKS